MSPDLIITGIFSVLAAGGFWAFMMDRAKKKDDEKNEFNAHLLKEINELKNKVNKLLEEKEELLLEISTLRSQLAATQQELHAMTSAIRYSQFQVRDRYEDGE
jgi:regulator of replication initiation timing